MEENNQKRMSFTAREDIRKKVEEEAEKTGNSKASVIRRLIVENLDNNENY